MSTTTMTPAETVRTHPEVRRAHESLHRAWEGATDPQVSAALERLACALRTDPTLALDHEHQRTLDLILELRRQLTPLSRQAALARERAALLADPDLDEVERARRVWVRLSQGRAGTLKRTGWRHFVDAAASRGSMPGNLHGYLERMLACAARLHEVSLECRDALEVIQAYGRHRSTLLYVDPPYLGSTGRARNYGTEMMGEQAHQGLAAALRVCRATVVLSGYASPLYEDLYSGWHRTEVLWSNRPLATAAAVGPDTLWPTGPEVAEIRNTDPGACNETSPVVRCAAPGCGLEVDQPSLGRRRRFCSAACRVKAHRAQALI